MTTRHIAYVAVTPDQVSALVYGTRQDYVPVFPDIVSASAHAASTNGAFVHEATITLEDGSEFLAGNEYTPTRFETFYDAYARGLQAQRAVLVQDAESNETDVCDHLKLGPRVSVIGW